MSVERIAYTDTVLEKQTSNVSRSPIFKENSTLDQTRANDVMFIRKSARRSER